MWPLLSIPERVFSNAYFAFWVLIAIAWGFGAALAITIIPLVESKDEIYGILNGIYQWATGKEIESAEEAAHHKFEKDDSEDTPLKDLDEEAPEERLASSKKTSVSSSVIAAAIEISDDDEVQA